MAFSGCLGQCASTHNLCAVECSKETWGPYGELFYFLLEKEPTVLRELIRLGPSIRPHGEPLSLMQKQAFVPDSEAFKSFIGDGFPVPELKGECEASEDEQAEKVSNEALYVLDCMDLVTKSLATSKIGRWQR